MIWLIGNILSGKTRLSVLVPDVATVAAALLADPLVAHPAAALPALVT